MKLLWTNRAIWVSWQGRMGLTYHEIDRRVDIGYDLSDDGYDIEIFVAEIKEWIGTDGAKSLILAEDRDRIIQNINVLANQRIKWIASLDPSKYIVPPGTSAEEAKRLLEAAGEKYRRATSTDRT